MDKDRRISGFVPPLVMSLWLHLDYLTLNLIARIILIAWAAAPILSCEPHPGPDFCGWVKAEAEVGWGVCSGLRCEPYHQTGTLPRFFGST